MPLWWDLHLPGRRDWVTPVKLLSPRCARHRFVGASAADARGFTGRSLFVHAWVAERKRGVIVDERILADDMEAIHLPAAQL